jgi:uncharacterized protein YjiK
LNLIEKQFRGHARSRCRTFEATMRPTVTSPVHTAVAAATLFLLLCSGVTPASARQARSALATYDFEVKDPVQYELGKALEEISGLAIDASGRIFAHQDERAVVFELDPRSGRTIRTFRLGSNGVRGDFEGIAIAGERMYLISSEGTLVSFAAGADGRSVEYERIDTGAKKFCREVEGLDYDVSTRSLLIACKFTQGKELHNRLVILGFSLRTRQLEPSPRLSIPLSALAPFGLDDELNPSGIAIHPTTGTLFVIAARENMIVELDRSGRVLGGAKLRGKVHHQPEGIAFGADGTLYIADEGRSDRATLTVYPSSPAATEPRSVTVR